MSTFSAEEFMVGPNENKFDYLRKDDYAGPFVAILNPVKYTFNPIHNIINIVLI